MAGYNGLGVSRKEIVQESISTEKIYELTAGDIYDGYAFDMREELLNHMIIVKSTVSNNMVSVFIPKTMGGDDDVIKFKLIDDLHDAGGDTPYIDFWGEDWAEDINVKDLQINNVDESDGFYWIAESQNEAFFKKVNGEWKVIRDKGVFDLNEFKNPQFGEVNVRNLIADNYLSIKVKDTYVANFNFDKFMISTMVQFKYALYSIYYDYQPEKTDLGLINRPFGDLFLKGNAISAEPTADNHLATKKYVDQNTGGGAFTPEFKQSIRLNAGALQDTWYCLTDLSGIGNIKPAYSNGGAQSIVLAQGFGDGKTGYIDGWDNTHKIAGKIDIETMGVSSGINFQLGLFRWNGVNELLYFDFPITGYAFQNAYEIQLPEYVQAITPMYFIGIKPLNQNLTIDVKINTRFLIYQ